jgi:lipopolysaccharide export system permease protein
MAKLGFAISILDRYLTMELILPFCFGMGLFTSLGLAIGTFFDLVRKITDSGLPIEIALRVLSLKMPEFIVLAFPMSMLLATLMAYSRLSSDSELIALRSFGIPIYRLVLPAILLSLCITGVAFLFNNFIAPASNYEAAQTLSRALEEDRPSFRESNIIYPEYQDVQQADGTKKNVLTRLFYAEEFDGAQMKGLTILDRTQKGVNQVITAESASWNPQENIWNFYRGTAYIVAPDGSFSNVIRFNHQKLELPQAPLDLAKNNLDYDQMSIVQALDYWKIIRLSDNPKKVRKLEVRIQQKISLPFVCLVFAILGAAIGLRPQNTGKATSFGICVGLVFCYYLLGFLASSLGIGGVLSPFLAAWLPNFLGLAAASFLLLRIV